VKRPGLNHTVNFPEHPQGGWRVWVNSLGLRGPEPAPSPDRRILVTGDSHTEGACRLRERYTELLQARLSEASGEEVEVVNAGVGGYDFYQYLGTLERLEQLDPDVFVVTVYGGNDFSGSVVLHHFWNGTRPVPLTDGYKRRIETALELSKIGLAQAFTQILFFDEHPAERAAALDAATGVTREIARQCDERGIALLVVYLPPMIDVQRERFEPWVTNMVRTLELDEETLHVSDRLADEWIADARAAGIDLLDLRPAFRASKEPLYWTSDHHIDLAGHALVAAKLFDRLR
jgi:lysophospholipase L1-like esterase